MISFIRFAGLVSLGLGLSACNPDDNTTPDPSAGEVNIYSARHYVSDDAVYEAFTDATGIQVNVIEAEGDLLIERVRADGERSPADVIVTVDAGRLHRAAEAGLFQPVDDLGGQLDLLPPNLVHPDNLWFGFSTRARVIAYAPDRIDPQSIATYESLAAPELEGRICVRSSNNVYNQSLLAALIERLGAQAAEAWAQGVVNNMARAPQGGDTDQLRAIAAGECDVAIVNHYYWGRLKSSEDDADQAVGNATAILFPNQAAGGTHINVSGAGLAAGAPNEDNARIFLEFLLLPEVQRFYPHLVSEYPAINGVVYDNDVLTELGPFQPDPLPMTILGENAIEAQRIFDRVGWE